MKSTLKVASYFQSKRISAGLSQKEVAEALGYKTPQFISNWERGLSTPPRKAILKLVKLYGVSVDEVYEIVLNETIEREKQRLAKAFKRSI